MNCRRDNSSWDSTLEDNENRICFPHVLRTSSFGKNRDVNTTAFYYAFGSQATTEDITPCVLCDKKVKSFGGPKVAQLKTNECGSAQRKGVIIACVSSP